jgi:hypothetical protein
LDDLHLHLQCCRLVGGETFWNGNRSARCFSRSTITVPLVNTHDRAPGCRQLQPDAQVP